MRYCSRPLSSNLQQESQREAIGQLAGGIAHDFNNILTAIIGYAEIITLKMEKMDSPLMHYAEQILLSAERAAELTNGLLAFSRKQVLHPKPIDLREVVRGLKKMLKRLIPEDIEFRVQVGDSDLVVMADKGQIEQVIMNLATNASRSDPISAPLHRHRFVLLSQRSAFMRLRPSRAPHGSAMWGAAMCGSRRLMRITVA